MNKENKKKNKEKQKKNNRSHNRAPFAKANACGLLVFTQNSPEFKQLRFLNRFLFLAPAL